MAGGLTERTHAVIARLFPQAQRTEVERIIADECGTNLPFCENRSPAELERCRFAALKLSEGDMNKLRRAVKMAQQDWRDVLVAAGFATSLGAHEAWADAIIHDVRF